MRQRVALCRALVHDPVLLLMDEPFGALDAMTRDQLNLDLSDLTTRSRKTVVFITHGIEEGVFLGDRVLVMSRGPGRIIADIAIDLDRPRSLTLKDDPAFTAYARQVREILDQAGVYQLRRSGAAETDGRVR
jgi:NitT/TauT family transport system ATP-binding protein